MRTHDFTSQALPPFQEKYLRGLANHLKPSLRVSEIKDSVIAEIMLAFDKQELLKIRLDHPIDKEFLAVELAEKTQSYLCGLIGHTVILYRRHPKNPQIQLPKKE